MMLVVVMVLVRVDGGDGQAHDPADHVQGVDEDEEEDQAVEGDSLRSEPLVLREKGPELGVWMMTNPPPAGR
jgi:hypothetical protein